MNRFEYVFYINDKQYYIYVDTSQNEIKKIILNNIEIVNEKYTLALNSKAYIIYYPIKIKEHTLVVSINDKPLKHEYNIFLDGVSLINNKRIDAEYERSKIIVQKGFKKFFCNNWLEILKENILELMLSVCGMAAFWGFALKEFTVKFSLVFIIAPLLLPLFVYIEWIHNKNIVKKYKSCFRNTKTYDC